MIRYRAFAIRTLLLLSCAVLAGCGPSAKAPVITLTPSGAQMVDQGQSVNFTSTQDVMWSLQSFGSLTNVTKNSVTYNAPAVVAATEVDHLIATSIADPSKSVTIIITLTAPPAVSTTQAQVTAAPATVGIMYSFTLTATGGAGTLTWSATGLPAVGLSLNASTGVVSGTPTSSGPVGPIMVTVKDSSAGSSGSQTSPPVSLTFTVNLPPPPTLTMISPTSGAQGANVPVTLTGSNFVAGSMVNFSGAGVTVASVVVVSGSSITATFQISATAALGAQTVSVTTAGGTSSTLTFTVNPPPPTLTSISPTSGVQGNAVPVTLTGTNFVIGASTINVPAGVGIAVSGTTVTSSTTITATFTVAATATLGAQNVSVTTASGTTGNQTFTVLPPSPTLTMISPTFGAESASVPVTLTGTNLVAGATVAVSGTGVTVTNVVPSGTTLTATFVIAANATLGARTVSVTTAGGTSGTQTFTINPPLPTLASINPTSGIQGNNVSVTLTGTNFVSPVINLSGTGVSPTSVTLVSSTMITSTFQVAANAPAGPQTVSVTTPGGTTTSTTVTFTVFAVPTLASVSPTSGVQSTIVPVTLTGTGFVAPFTVNFSGAGVVVANPTLVNGTTITATLQISATAALGGQNISVMTPGGTTPTQTFTVNPPPPTLTSVSPTSGIQGTNVNVTLTGTAFVAPITINLSGTGVTPTSVVLVNSTTITSVFQVAANAPLVAQNVTVTALGGTSGSQTFTVAPPPTLASINPTSGDESASVPVTLTGTNFFNPATINFSGTGITATNVNATSTTTITATFVIAANAPLSSQNVSVTTSGMTTTTVPFTVNPPLPTLTSLSPTSGIQGTNVNVTLTGTNFVVGASTILVTPGTGITVVGTTVTSGSTITATFQIAAGAPLGAQGVMVMTAGGTTMSQTFTVAAPPTLTSISPTNGDESANVPVTLTGTNFFTPAMINFSGMGITATNVNVTSTTTITATLVIAANASLASQNVSVTTSGVTTSTVMFTVNPPLPTLTSLSQTVGAQGTMVIETLTGTNFIAGATTVNVPAGGGIAVSGTMVTSSTTLTATFTVAANATLGGQNVSVTTAGGTTTNKTFTVMAPATLASINPTSGDEAASVPVTLMGANFVSPANISFNGGTGITATNVTVVAGGGSITATFMIAANAPLGVQNISVTSLGVTTATVGFTVNPPLPTLTSLGPTFGAQGTMVNETLTGTNFIAGATTVNVPAGGGIAVSGTMVTSSTTLTTTFTIAANATLGGQNVSVTTGGGTSGSQTFTVARPIIVTFVMAPLGSLQVSNSMVVSANVANDGTNAGVDWTVTCGSVGACGSFNPMHTVSGANTTYTAPAAVPTGTTVTIKAASTADNTKSVTANTTITPTPIMIIFMPILPASVATSSMTVMSSTVSNDPMNKGVDWTVTCGSVGACGSFNPMHTASGANTTYTAPAAVPAGGTVTIKAASTADNTKFVTGNVTITGGALTCPLPLGGQESLLTGTYAILFNGWNDGLGMFQAAASVIANGTGTITGGVDDSNGIGLTPKVNQTITSGCYTIGAGGRGKMIWTFSGSGNSIGFSFVMRADGKNGNLIEFDDPPSGSRGSGSIRLQDPTLFVASTLTSSWAFGVRGEKSDSTRVGSLGAFTLNGAALTLTGGAVDYSEPGTSLTGLTATGSFTAPDATHGRGTLTLVIANVPNIGTLTLHFAYYITRGGSGTIPIIYLQSTDTPDAVGHPLQNGRMAKQSGGPFSAASVTGSVIFALTGFDSSHGITNTIVGLATSPGDGTFTGVADQEADLMPIVNTAVSGTIAIGANGLGTVAITSPAVLVPTSIVMVAPNTALMLEGTATGPGNDAQSGILQPQTGSNFNTGSLVGTFISGSDEPATTATQVEVGTVAVTSPGNITITEDNSSTGGLQTGTVMTGTYTMAANGRGDITITSGGTGTAVIWLLGTNKAVVMLRGGGDIALLNLEQ